MSIVNEYVVFRKNSALLLNYMFEVDAISPFPRDGAALYHRFEDNKTRFRYSPSPETTVNELIPVFEDSKFDYGYNEEMLNKSNREFQTTSKRDDVSHYIALIPNNIYITYKYLENKQHLIQLNHHFKHSLLPDITPLIMVSLLEILRTNISTYKVIEPY